MQLDGEWRLANLKQDKVAFPYAAAPMPVADDRADTYGAGYVTGTVAASAPPASTTPRPGSS